MSLICYIFIGCLVLVSFLSVVEFFDIIVYRGVLGFLFEYILEVVILVFVQCFDFIE